MTKFTPKPEDRTTMPVQLPTHSKPSGTVPTAVYMAAYEVYAHLHGEQPAMIEGGCRGGFGQGELIAFLYARSFPKTEWRQRCAEAFREMILR